MVALRILIVLITLIGTVSLFLHAWRLGRVYLALAVPIWVRFMLGTIYELTSDKFDSPGSFWLTDAWNPYWHWTPMFKPWVWLLYLVAILGIIAWKFASEENTLSKVGGLVVVLSMTLATLGGYLSTDWGNFSYSESAAIQEASFTVTDNGDLTVTLENKSPGEGNACNWRILDQAGNPVPGIEVKTGCKLTTPKLPAAGPYTFELSITNGGKEVAASAKTFTVSAPGAPAVSGDQTIANGCPQTWVVQNLENSDYRFLVNGLESIQNAYAHQSDEEAKAAALDWMEHIKVDPTLLQGTIDLVLDESPRRGDLVSGGCASDLANAYRIKVLDELRNAAITAEEAPSTGINTGYKDGKIGRSSRQGVTGDRAAIKVVLANGRTFWILGRCGQWVFVGESPIELPEGPTDEKEVEAQAATATTPPASQPSSPPTSSAPSPTPAGPTPTPPAPTPPKNVNDSVFTPGTTDERNQGQDSGGTWNNGQMQSTQTQSPSSPQPAPTVDAPVEEVNNGTEASPGASNSPGTDWSGCNPDGSNC